MGHHPFLLANGRSLACVPGIVWLEEQDLPHPSPQCWRSRISPTLRHNSAFILLTAGSAWFLYTFAQEYATFWQIDRYLSMLPDAEKATPTTAVAITGFREFQQRLAHFAETNIAYVSAIYLIVLSFMVWRLLQAFLQSK
ncbi:MAG: LPS export ABC transporter periplasmic protein LptC, partial [Chitinophagaceae bacterium]|nr:LPS export ABC transporter periplasmic protein LptC [Chitinophagaceae bacterium]